MVSVLPLATGSEYVGCRREQEGSDFPGELSGNFAGPCVSRP